MKYKGYNISIVKHDIGEYKGFFVADAYHENLINCNCWHIHRVWETKKGVIAYIKEIIDIYTGDMGGTL